MVWATSAHHCRTHPMRHEVLFGFSSMYTSSLYISTPLSYSFLAMHFTHIYTFSSSLPHIPFAHTYLLLLHAPSAFLSAAAHAFSSTFCYYCSTAHHTCFSSLPRTFVLGSACSALSCLLPHSWLYLPASALVWSYHLLCLPHTTEPRCCLLSTTFWSDVRLWFTTVGPCGLC